MTLYNLARMSTATTGTGTITLGSAVSGYLSFAAAGASNGETVSYGIMDGANSEVGTGTYTSSGTTLTRTVLRSTNANAAISLSGSAEVFITALAEDFAAKQPIDADLTSWAGVTRAAGFDTFAATPTSDNLAALVSNETGSGALVFATSPALVTPAIGVATATSVNKVAITAPAISATLTIPDGVTLTGPAASGTAATLGNAETITGAKTFGAAGNVGKLIVAGTTSGSTIVNATAAASGTLTLPAATDTLVGKATTDTLTNKTFDTAGSGNSFSINGVAATTNTGTGAVVRETSPTLVTPALGTPSALVLTNATGLPVAGGGTGVATNTAYAVLCGGTTGTNPVQSIVGVGTAGQVLTSNGAAALPTFQAAAGGGGKYVNRAYGEYLTNANLTTTIPLDDTIPQNTEGTEILNVSITPASTTNRVRATFTGFVSSGTAADQHAIAALFKDTTAGALAATAVKITDVTNSYSVCGGNVPANLANTHQIQLVFEHVPGTTSAVAYKIRVGGSGGTVRMNGSISARYFGGIAGATLVLDEVTP